MVYLNYVFKNLRRRKLRSWLTIIGIVVGVLAIVSLMSLSEGLKETIESEFDKMGARKITVESKYTSFGAETDIGLTTTDLRVIEKIGGIDYAVGQIVTTAPTDYKNKLIYTRITGYDLDHFEDIIYQDNLKLLKGKLLSSKKGKEVIIGYAYHKDYDDLYEKQVNLGDKILINDEGYKVIGILDDTGSKATNSAFYLSIDNVRDIAEVKENVIDTIFAIVKENKDSDAIGEKISKKLEQKRGTDDFKVTTPKKASENRQKTLGVVSIVIIGIAAISLLVGGIGIMNSMYTSVVERRKEIGILKAIGAKRSDILIIFLLEAGIIGVIGGTIGLLLGFGLAGGVSTIAKALGQNMTYVVNLTIISIAILFSFLIGILSGLYPAFKASGEEPVEALREE